MRNPEIVLNTLCQHSKVSDYKFERLYRILFNKEMFFIAWLCINALIGNEEHLFVEQNAVQSLELIVRDLTVLA